MAEKRVRKKNRMAARISAKRIVDFLQKGQGAAYLRLRVAVVEDHAEELGRRLQGGLLVHLATRSHRIICSC